MCSEEWDSIKYVPRKWPSRSVWIVEPRSTQQVTILSLLVHEHGLSSCQLSSPFGLLSPAPHGRSRVWALGRTNIGCSCLCSCARGFKLVTCCEERGSTTQTGPLGWHEGRQPIFILKYHHASQKCIKHDTCCKTLEIWHRDREF